MLNYDQITAEKFFLNYGPASVVSLSLSIVLVFLTAC